MKASDLRDLAALAGSLPRRWPEGPADGPRADAALRLVVQPGALLRLVVPSPLPDPGFWGHRTRLPGPWGESPPMGLSPARNSDTPRRYGWNGLTAKGRRTIRSVTSALETRRRDAAFWTISLPGPALDQLAANDSWPVFQDAIRRNLRRRLRPANIGGEAIGVVELQPERTAREGRPCPHLHVVFLGKRPGRKVWALHRTVLDRIIVQSLAAAGVHGVDVAAAGNVQPVRRTVAGYLAKYLTKAGVLEEEINRQLELIPRQWWFVTREAVAFAARFRFTVPARFALWLVDACCSGGGQAGVEANRLALPDARAPATWVVGFDHPDAFGRALLRWRDQAGGGMDASASAPATAAA